MSDLHPLDRISLNPDGTVDEVVLHRCTVHIEQMRQDAWWLGLDHDGKEIHVWFTLERGRLRVEVTEDAIGLPVEHRKEQHL